MFSKVKQHISNNRGKYGTAVGAGAAYGASQIDTPLMNQAKFNAMAHGQNLAHDSANYIDGKLNTNLVNNLNSVGVRNIDPEQINTINQGYDKFKGTTYTGADAKDAINMAEFNSIPYTQRIASNGEIDDARMDYLKSGANFIKKSAGQAYDHMTESTGVICIPIKHALLEGYQPEAIVEMAVHTNHPLYRKNKNSQFQITNRNKLAKRIIDTRESSKLFKKLDDIPYSNYLDNKARAISQDPHNSFPVEQSKEMLNKMTAEEKKSSNYSTKTKPFEEKPRIISSAKQ